jgi:hypothetical protein
VRGEKPIITMTTRAFSSTLDAKLYLGYSNKGFHRCQRRAIILFCTISSNFVAFLIGAIS